MLERKINMEKTMKAVVKYDNVANATELRDMPVPEIGPTDVLVRVAYIGICGTDPHMHQNLVSFEMNVPLIFGHEFAGTIEKVGSEVKGYKPGDRVTAETHADYCGSVNYAGPISTLFAGTEKATVLKPTARLRNM